jgi:GGDEF domain-containing protein
MCARRAITKSIRFEGQYLSINASVGVAIYPDDGEQIDGLMSKVDTVMYEDKAVTKVAEKS